MATPNKQFNSPYSTPQKYPSQSVDYISLEMGGSNRKNFKMQSTSFQTARESPYQRKNMFNNRNDFRDNKRKQFNNTSFPQNPRQSTEYDFKMYFHPSMLEDPWEKLIKRHEALCASKINSKEESSD